MRTLAIGASAVASAVLLSAGCAGAEPELDADSPVFAGLPPAVVQESLSDPGVQKAITVFSDDEKPGALQLNVWSRVFCRDLLVEYENWVTTGKTPEVPRVAEPTNPESGFDEFETDWVKTTQGSIDSGDPDQLRSQLLAGGGGCRDVVADPQANGQETVADRLEG